MACEIANFQMKHVLAVKDLVDKENIDCDFQLTRACDAMLDQADADKVTASFFKIRASGASCVREVQYTGPRDAEQACFSDLYTTVPSFNFSRFPVLRVLNAALPFPQLML